MNVLLQTNWELASQTNHQTPDQNPLHTSCLSQCQASPMDQPCCKRHGRMMSHVTDECIHYLCVYVVKRNECTPVLACVCVCVCNVCVCVCENVSDSRHAESRRNWEVEVSSETTQDYSDYRK